MRREGELLREHLADLHPPQDPFEAYQHEINKLWRPERVHAPWWYENRERRARIRVYVSAIVLILGLLTAVAGIAGLIYWWLTVSA